MLASLIPFFLVARVEVDESMWKHGPEYVFDVKMNITSTPMDYEGAQISNYTMMNLFCRPRGPDGLNCRLANCRKQSMDVTNDNEIEITEAEAKHLCSEDPFEIKFNDHGVEYLVVDEGVHVENLNELKLLVERFNIGADLNGVPDGTFEIVENTTIGQCVVIVGINHFPSKGGISKTKNYRYELESLPHLNKVPGEAIVIQKSTNLNNCSCYAPFYFGSYGGVVVESDLHSSLESSSSRLFVSDVQFVSSMTRIGTLGSDKLKNLLAISQYVSLSLRDIRAAKRALADISAAAETTILANSDVDRIFTMK